MECSRSPVDEQSDSGHVCKQHGQDHFHPGNTDHQGSVDVVPPERHITLLTQYLLGKDNTIADQNLREMKDHSNWLLHREVFRMILCRFPSMNINLFASHLTFQLPRFFSWRPDPVTEATDAFQQN